MEKYYEEYANVAKTPEDSRNDHQKIQFLSVLMRIRSNYEVLRKHADHCYSHHRSRTADQPQCKDDLHDTFPLSRTPSAKTCRTFSFFTKKKICNTHSDKTEEVQLIKFVFKKIIGVFHEGGQNETIEKLHVTYLTQFLLDCYILTQHFLSLFLLPLKKETYIDVDMFILSLESIQQMSFERASFFYQEKDSHFKKNIAIQKMLCKIYAVFFKFMEYCCGNELSEADLSCVLSLALRNNKNQSNHKNLAKNTFDRIERLNRGVRKSMISFDEFFMILMNNN